MALLEIFKGVFVAAKLVGLSEQAVDRVAIVNGFAADLI
jgi:hypothetical protein